MNADNMCHLQGWVQNYPLYGPCWTRYNRHQRGQVRFWLGMTRELAGDGLDVVLCAIEPRTAEELVHYQEELRAGRSVQITATAHSLVDQVPGESTPGVIFVAESCGFDGRPVAGVHHVPKKATGKMAAANDPSELPLEVRP